MFEIAARGRVFLGRKRLVLELPKNGHLECLKYLHEKGCPLGEETDLLGSCQRWSPRVFEICTHEKGCPWDEMTCSMAAARGGHLECLKYAHEQGVSLGRNDLY